MAADGNHYNFIISNDAYLYGLQNDIMVKNGSI
jgi:hypothetical protein